MWYDPKSVHIITPSPVEPLTLAEAKLYLRVDHNADDDLISHLITIAREEIETQCARQVLTSTLAWRLDTFPAAVLQVPYPPLQTIETIAYLDSAGVLQTIDPALYTVDPYGDPGRLALVPGATWPQVQATLGAITITFVAGWTPATLPHRVRQLMRLLIGGYYEHREEDIELRLTPNKAVQRLLWSLRLYTLM